MEEEEGPSKVKKFLSFIFFLCVLILLVLYWFFPFGTINFGSNAPKHSNFSLINETRGMQFYSNMRFQDKRISYSIEDCTLQKEQDMKQAFDIVQNSTSLEFYETNTNEEIFVTCDSKAKISDSGLFIAGEGGPTNITVTENFNIITTGTILLYKDSRCERPNIAIHELLHALGFDHSSNQNNIMYNVSKCKQVMSQDIIELINELYSYPVQPDLSFENVSATMQGRFLDFNLTVRNNGLIISEEATIVIYGDDKVIKEFEIKAIDFGKGSMITSTNNRVLNIGYDSLRFFINTSFEELNKDNNEIILDIKK